MANPFTNATRQACEQLRDQLASLNLRIMHAVTTANDRARRQLDDERRKIYRDLAAAERRRATTISL